MLKISPQRYEAGRDLIKNLGEPLESLGERALVIADKSVLERFEENIRSTLKDSMIGVSFEVCLGECCLPEVERLVEEVKKEKADIVVGIGGGTTLDVSKYVGQMADCDVVTVPTVASSCAAYTNIVHLYSEDGDFIEEVFLETCPELLVLDYKVAGLAESRYLAAGMAIAFTVGITSRETDVVESQSRRIARELSRHLEEFLREEARPAMTAVKKGEVSPQLESVVEANILEAGLIHTLGGNLRPALLPYQLAYQLFTYAEEEILFGEVVAFGAIVAETLRAEKDAQLEETFSFYRDLGLPLHLEALGLPSNQKETIVEDAVEVASGNLEENPEAQFVPAEELFEAVQHADELGRQVSQTGLDALT